MAVRKVPRAGTAPKAAALHSGLVVDAHTTIPLPMTEDIKRFDFGLLVGANRESVSVGIDSSATAHGIAAVGMDTGLAFAWVLKTSARGPRRLVEIHGYVERLLRYLNLRYGVVEVCMEQYAFSSKGQSHLIGEVGGQTKTAMLKALGSQNSVAYATYPTGTQLKKFATGRGDGEKSDVKMAVFKKWGWEVPENNAADALTLAQMAKALHSGSALLGYEQDVITKLEHRPEWLKSPNP